MFETLREARKSTTGKMFRKLHGEMKETVTDLKRCEAAVIQKLQEIDKHLVHRYLGYNSLFQYAVCALGLTEAQSYAYIAVVRKAEQYPKLQEAIESGELTVSKAVRITSVIDDRNQEKWIGLAITSSKRELEKEVAKVNPRLVQAERVRFVNENTLELQLPISEEIYALLERAKALESQRRSAVATTEETLKEVLEFFLDRKDPVRKALRRAKKKTQRKDHGADNDKDHDEDKCNGEADVEGLEQKQPLAQVRNGPLDKEAPSSRSADCRKHEDQPSLGGFSLSHPSDSDPESGDQIHFSSDLNADANSARAEISADLSCISKVEKEIRSPNFRARGPDGREPGPVMDAKSVITPGSADRSSQSVARDETTATATATAAMNPQPRQSSAKASPLDAKFRPGQGQNQNQRVDLDAKTQHQLNLRDQGQCRIILSNGTRCAESRWTEVHHIVEVCRGGTNDLENLITVCHGHHRAIHQASVHR